MSDAFIAAHRRRRKFTTEQMMALKAEGLTQKEAARRLGVTQSAIALRLARDGLFWCQPERKVDNATFSRLWRCHSITTEEIATWMGVTRQAVSDRARRSGLPSRVNVRRKLIRETELRDLWMAGVALKDIAAYFGCASTSSVTRAALAAGLPERPLGSVSQTSMDEYREMKLGERMLAASRVETA